MTYRDNLREPSARKFFDCLVDQMYLGVRYCPMRSSVIPGAFTDDELRTMKNPILLLLGQEEVICNPAAAAERARRLVPNLRAELIPDANHDLTTSRAKIVDEKILEFLRE